MLTTNKKRRQWGEVLHDPQLAETLLDLILERGLHITLSGASWRTKGKPDADTTQKAQS